MSLLTNIFNFIKPQKTDPAAIGQLSSNWDTLDGILALTPSTVNNVPVTTGTRDIQIESVPLADNLSSDSTQLDTGSYIERTSGGTASIANGDASLVSISGGMIHTGVVQESITMDVDPAERGSGEPITATIDEDTFKSVVTTSGTTSFVYSTSWNLDPSTYGITVTGTPIAGDAITVVYVKENRGTITTATPTTFNSTGWNLFSSALGYAKVVYYSDEYGYRIDGEYLTVEFSPTVTGNRTTVSVYDGNFNIPADGYVFVTGYDSTTCVYLTWEDWIDGHTGAYEAYSLDTIDFSSVMVNFNAGLCAVGSVADEINFNLQTAISRIERITYTEEAIAAVIESGRDYDADTNYIYAVRATPVTYSFTIDGTYTVSDHGLEYLTGSTVPCTVVSLYGNNLKNKLERDVLTKSQDIVNNLNSTATNKVLSAAQGKVLGDSISQIVGNLKAKYFYKTTSSGKAININNIETGSQHFFLLTSNGVERFAVLYVRVGANGSVSVKELHKGSTVASISTATANRVTVTFDNANMRVNIYDILMYGTSYAN